MKIAEQESWFQHPDLLCLPCFIKSDENNVLIKKCFPELGQRRADVKHVLKLPDPFNIICAQPLELD